MTTATDASRTLADLVSEMQGRVVCLASSKDPNPKLTVLLFAPGAAEPSLVAKVPTTPAAVRQVRREAAALEAVAGRELGTVSATVPRVVEIVDHLGKPVLVTTALPGRPMIATYHAWRHTARPASVERDFATALDWLGELHRATSTGHAELVGILAGLDERLCHRFGDDPELGRDLEELAVIESRLAGRGVSVGWVHGDFWAGNLLVQGPDIRGVVDWEDARPQGPMVCDFARFALSYALYLDRHTRRGREVSGHPGLVAGPWAAGVDYVVRGTGWFPGLVRDFLRAGLAGSGAEPELWRELLLAELLVVASQADQLRFARQHLLVFRRLARGGGPT